MTGERRLYLDESPGETRGVVTLDGRPERLWIARPGDLPAQQMGARQIGRIRRIDRGLATAFIALAEGPDAVLALSGGAAKLTEGQAVEVTITAPARRGKGPVARLVSPAEGQPRLMTPGPSLAERLRAAAPDQQVETGADAREIADEAEETALAVEHGLGGGASLAIEPTRALVAIDVDVGGAGGGDSRRGAAKVNRLAIEAAARLLRLKGLGGLVVFDLAGVGQDAAALNETAKAAFAPDMPGVVFGPLSRLGTFQLALPRRERPVAEILCDLDGAPSAATVAARLARAIEREARTCVRVRAVCAPDVAEAARGLEPALLARLGPRFDIVGDAALTRGQFETRPR